MKGEIFCSQQAFLVIPFLPIFKIENVWLFYNIFFYFAPTLAKSKLECLSLTWLSQEINLTWLDLTWLDLTWLDLTWLDLTWLDLTWLDLAYKCSQTFSSLSSHLLLEWSTCTQGYSGSLSTLLTDIKGGCIGLPRTNTLAYFRPVRIEGKSFITSTDVSQVFFSNSNYSRSPPKPYSASASNISKIFRLSI
jgi:hypothetical protein